MPNTISSNTSNHLVESDRQELENEVQYLRRKIAELERSQAELLETQKELKESKEKLRNAIDGSGGAEWEIKLNPEDYSYPLAIRFSPAFKKMLGYEDDEMPDTMEAWRTFVHPDDAPHLRQITRKLLKEGYDSDLSEFRFVHRNGDVRWLQATTKILHDEQGRPSQMIGVDWDITKRKQEEEELRSLQQNLELRVQERTTELERMNEQLEIGRAYYYSITDNFPNGIVLLFDRELKIQFINGLGLRDLGLKRYNLESRCLTEIVDSSTLQPFMKHFDRVFEGKSVQLEYDYQDQSFAIYMVPVFRPEGGVISGLALTQDITSHVQLQDLLHRRAQELIAAQENERHSISRDLHDGVAQTLSSAKMSFDMLFPKDKPLSKERVEIVDLIRDALDTSLREVRELAQNLRPLPLQTLGLVRSVKNDCAQFESRTGVETTFNESNVPDLSRLPQTEIQVYRIVQETMKNTENHANASSFLVEMRWNGERFYLFIKDDGCGFDMSRRFEEARADQRMGLFGMRERAAMLNGELDIHSEPGKGTTVALSFPLTGTQVSQGQNTV